MMGIAKFDARKFDRQIELLKRSENKNEYGEVVISWILVANLWAEWRPQTARELISSGQEQQTGQDIFVVRWSKDISSLNKIRFNNEEYDIANVMEIGRREGLQILGKIVYDRVQL
jgi:SPP1 family predicted phage head-tail adaptor